MLSFNVHASGVHNWNALDELIAKIRPQFLLIMDFDAKRALPLQERHPYTRVILRVPMHHSIEQTWSGLSPSEWVNALYAHSAGGRLIMQWLNEPNGYGAPVEASACASLMQTVGALARSRGLTLAGPNFAVGHPLKRWISGGSFDGAIRTWIENGHILALHEYALRGNLAPGDLIGRFKIWEERAQQIGARPPVIVITETGHDIQGGHGDGYKNHMSSAGYANLLKSIGSFYAGSSVKSACVYCYGSDGNWDSFDIQGDGEVLKAFGRPVIAWKRGKIRVPALSVNVRQEPNLSGRIVGRIIKNQIVEYRDVDSDFYEVRVTFSGFVSKQNGAVYFENE